MGEDAGFKLLPRLHEVLQEKTRDGVQAKSQTSFCNYRCPKTVTRKLRRSGPELEQGGGNQISLTCSVGRCRTSNDLSVRWAVWAHAGNPKQPFDLICWAVVPTKNNPTNQCLNKRCYTITLFKKTLPCWIMYI